MRSIWKNLIDQQHIEIELSTQEKVRGMTYTKEITEKVIKEYQNDPSKETVERLAEVVGVSTKSIIGKLSREGVYQRKVYLSKTGEAPVTKAEIVNSIADALGLEVESLSGLEKSPKIALKNLERGLNESNE